MDSLAETKALVHQIFDEASSQLQVSEPYTGQNNLEALLTKKALEITIGRSQTIRSVQMQIVAKAARDEIWLSHPPTHDFPNGYGNLNEMLTEAGFKGSTKSYLLALGEDIVPFCDRYDIGIDEYMTNSLRPKFEYAIAALKEGIRGDDPRGVEMVLQDVQAFASRDAIRVKYHTPRNRHGRGTTLRLDDGRALVIMVLDNDDYVEPVIGKVAGIVEWGLPAQARLNGALIHAEISSDTG